MTLIRLTDPNMAVLKRLLRTEHPGTGAAHLTEALASALSRRTYAALLADVKARTLSTAPLARFDIDAFYARLATLSPAKTSASLSNRLGSLLLPNPCWKMFANIDRSANDEWYFTCCAENLPNVCVRMRRKYAELAWDGISLDSSYDHNTHGKSGTALSHQMFQMFQQRARHRPGKPIYFGSAFVGAVDPVDPEIARQLADDYFELLYEATRTRKAAA
jgi:hypothetical protein